VLIVVGLLAVGCKSKRQEAPAMSGTSSSGSGSAGGNGSAANTGSGVVADVPPAPSALDAAALPRCDGWKASKTEWMGMGEQILVVECAKDTPTISYQVIGARDEDVDEPVKKPMSREAWNELWRRLEGVGSWRTLPAKCPPVPTPPESTDFTDLELEISDGTMTRELKCEAVNLSAAHDEIRAAFDDAATSAHLLDE
jgi:hypothetical protein